MELCGEQVKTNKPLPSSADGGDKDAGHLGQGTGFQNADQDIEQLSLKPRVVPRGCS